MGQASVLKCHSLPPIDYSPPDYGAKYPAREIRRVETRFSLNPEASPRRSGIRPLWRLRMPDGEPVLVGMTEMTLIDQEWVHPGESAQATWEFFAGVQGYIEELVKPGDVIEVTEDGRKVIGFVTITDVVY